MIEVKAVSVHYKKLNLTCAYKLKKDGCDGDVEFVRVTVLTDGTTMVSTMCKKHRIGEGKHCMEDGMVMVGEASVAGMVSDAMLVDPNVIAEQMNQVSNLSEEESEEIQAAFLKLPRKTK